MSQVWVAGALQGLSHMGWGGPRVLIVYQHVKLSDETFNGFCMEIRCLKHVGYGVLPLRLGRG